MSVTLLKSRYSDTDPATFQLGDIVEVTVAFVVLPVGAERYVMVPQLRVLTLLDNVIRQVRTTFK